MKILIVAFALVATLFGCAATGPTFSPIRDIKSGQGIVYVYRPEIGGMSALSAVFDIDGRKVATLEKNGYAAVPISAGPHIVGHEWKAGIIGNSKLESKPIFITVNVIAGQGTYVRLNSQVRSEAAPVFYPGIAIKTQTRWALEEVVESIALAELKQTKGTTVEP